jgi:hypothetical protein
LSHQGWLYAIQRIDLLIITISGAGILLILETLKFSLENRLPCICVIKISAVLFVLAIIVNFISQFTGKNANRYDMLWCQDMIDEIQHPPINPNAENTNDLKSDFFSKWTRSLNLISMISMFLGLIMLIFYFLFTF